MDTQFLTDWFGISGAIFAVILALFKIIYPKIEAQLKAKNDLKKQDMDLRKRELDNSKDMIAAVRVTNALVEKNNEAFNRHNAIFDIHIQLIRELKEQQKVLKSDLHRRFDSVEDKLETHHQNALLVGYTQDELVHALRNLYGIGINIPSSNIVESPNDDKKD